MDALGIGLFIALVWAFARPKQVGRWVRDVRAGYLGDPD